MDHGILFDHARTSRIGLPEAVFCEGKPFEAVGELLSRFGRGSGRPILFTRLAPDIFAMMPEQIRASYDYDPLSRSAKRCPPGPGEGSPSYPPARRTAPSPGKPHARCAIWASRTRCSRTAAWPDCGGWLNGWMKSTPLTR